ncbi:MAG: NAD-dependent epimerase/dehydratase family protein [Desulfobacteraceae bacterium]|nr:NAD-dependent epimerase/dehydratase family protein [Desulfobacteraceae bacterium]MBU4055413.1 NAD-dependent epimerase/dehydratase family protein [Pseudomonadota bacterium]
MNYLITGATGFIGPHLIRRLTSEGHRCKCLARKGSESKIPEIPGVTLITGDITEPETLVGIAEGTDCVLHLATIGHMSNFTVTEEMFESINVQGTINIMNEAIHSGVKKIVHCSSTAAMGICDEIPSTEYSICKPHHPYGRSKLKAEKEILRMVKESSLPAVIVRFSMVYGPGEPRDMLKIIRLKKKGLLPKIGSKPKLTPLIHMEDAIQGLLLASQKGRIGEIYLITNPKPEPFDDIVKFIQEGLGSSKPSIFIPEWVALSMATLIEKTFSLMKMNPPVSRKNIESTLADRVFSIKKAQLELDFHPQINPNAGIKEMVDWYLKNGWI